jgi:tetratricopeptide (TPR) repeat protein
LVVFALFASVRAEDSNELEKAVSLFEAANFDEAATCFKEVVEQQPENPEAPYYLGQIALERGDVDGAVDWFKRATKLDADESEYHLWLGRALSVKIQSVSFFEKGGIANRMLDAFETAVELDPESIEARAGLAQYYLSAPAIAGGSISKAKKQAEEIKKRAPGEGHLLMAQVYVHDGDHESAEKEFSAALELDPNNTDLHYQIGMFHQGQKQYDKAVEAFQKSVETDPGNLNALYQVGRTSVFSGENLDRAIECLAEYLEHESQPGTPSKAHAHWRLGMLYEIQGRPDVAREAYEAALRLDPDNKEAKGALKELD